MTIQNDPRLCPLFSFHSLSRIIDGLSTTAFKDCPVSAAHGHLLLVIMANPKLTLSDLSTTMNLKPSTMTRFIDKLQEQGLVNRIHDGRKVRVEATPKAIALEGDITKALETLKNLYIEKFGERLTNEIFNLCTAVTSAGFQDCELED